MLKTSRDRPNSAPYLRLKNSKRTSKCQSIGELGTLFFKVKKVSQCRKKLKGRTLWDFSTSILSQNSKKNESGPFGGKKFEKKSHSAETNLFGLLRYLWSPPVLYVTPETFLVQFLGPTGTIWRLLKIL